VNGRMQVEVSKHTEGFKENALRPNGLPESLIRYDCMVFQTHLIYNIKTYWLGKYLMFYSNILIFSENNSCEET